MNTAARVGSINVVLNTTFGAGVRGLNTFANTVERTGVRTQKTVGGIDRSVLGMNRTMSGIGANAGGFRSLAIGALRTRDGIGQMNNALLATSALLGGLIPTLSGAYLLRMADRAQLAANNLRTVTDSSQELRNIQQELFLVSQKSRSSLEATATIYSRTARATKDFGISQKELLRITETINKSFAAGGANPAEAKGAAIQLTQGIASDRFSGDEFRSVAENAPILLKGIADSLGVNIGRLREMAHAGELTAKVVTDAILRSSSSIDESFDKTVSTIGQATVKLDNAILQYVSNSDNVTVASGAFVTVINAVAENLDTVTDSLVILGGALVGTFVSRRVAEVLAYNKAVGAQLVVTRQATSGALDRAKAEAAAASFQARSSAAALVAAQRGAVTESTLNKLRKQSVVNLRANVAAQANLTSATLAHSSALNAASVSGRAFAGVGAIASSAWSFIGGPFGAALLAVSGALFIAQKESAEAEARVSRYSDAIRLAGEDSDGSVEGIRKAAMALNDVAEFASVATLQTRLQQSSEDIAAFKNDLDGLASAIADDLFRNRDKSGSEEFADELDRFIELYKANEISAKELINELDNLAAARPGLSSKIEATQTLIQSLEAAKGTFEGLTDRLNDEDGRSIDIDVNVRINRAFGANDDGTFDIDPNRFGDGPLAGDKLNTEINKKLLADRRDRGIDTRKPRSSRGSRRPRKSEAEKQVERFQRELNKLDYSKATFGLSEIDNATIGIAKSAKVADSTIRQFIEASQSGGELPEELLQIKMRLEEIQQLEFNRSLEELSESNVVLFLSELDRKTVETARSFGVAEEEVQSFIQAAASGDLANIPSQLSQVRGALEEVTQNERNKQGIDDISNALGNFASSAILDFNNIGDSVGNLLSRLAEIYVQMVLIEPLIQSLSGGGGGGGGALGGVLSFLGGAFVPTNHTGGDAGVSNSGKFVSASALNNAQKFHSGKSGVGHNEVMALLEKSESVFTSGQTQRLAGALGASMDASRGGGGKSVVEVMLGPDLVARIMSQAKDQSVEVNKRALKDYTKNVLPKQSMRSVQQSVRAGKSIGGA